MWARSGSMASDPEKQPPEIGGRALALHEDKRWILCSPHSSRGVSGRRTGLSQRCTMICVYILGSLSPDCVCSVVDGKIQEDGLAEVVLNTRPLCALGACLVGNYLVASLEA